MRFCTTAGTLAAPDVPDSAKRRQPPEAADDTGFAGAIAPLVSRLGSPGYGASTLSCTLATAAVLTIT
jgi:hypothetical protein